MGSRDEGELVPKLVWRVKLVAEFESGELNRTTEVEVAHLEGSMQTRGVHCTIAAVASSPFAGWKPEYRGRKAASSTPFCMASQ